MPALDVLLRDLALPTAYPDSDWGDVPPNARTVEVVQTHISAVFLTAKSAYKVKKPVRLWGLVDYGTLEARKHWCDEEVRLNRRLAPDVYRGVVPIVKGPRGLSVGGAGGAGDAVEWAVAMRRFRPEDTLEARVLAGTATETELVRLGELLASFHGRHRLPEGVGPRAALFAGVLAQNMRATRAFVPALFPAGAHDDLERALARRLRRHRKRLRRRLRLGLAVDGHGDVRLEHVLIEGAKVSVIDCVEFTTVWRHIDPVADAAFLVMDLVSRGAMRLARAFVQGYMLESKDQGDGLWELFTAYRAHVRAKVDATTSLESEVPAEQRVRKAASARNHLALAWTLARYGRARAPLVVMRGASGTGKSVLAAALAPWLMADVLQSDVVRKDLFGLSPLDRPSLTRKAELYGERASVATYAEVLRRGLATVRGGHPALLDATYLRRDSRQAVYDAAVQAGVPCVVVDVTAPPDVVRARLAERARRNDDPSDADVAVYEEQLRTEEPLTEDERARVVEHPAGTDPSVTLLGVVERAATLDAGRGRRDDGDSGAASAPLLL